MTGLRERLGRVRARVLDRVRRANRGGRCPFVRRLHRGSQPMSPVRILHGFCDDHYHFSGRTRWRSLDEGQRFVDRWSCRGELVLGRALVACVVMRVCWRRSWVQSFLSLSRSLIQSQSRRSARFWAGGPRDRLKGLLLLPRLIGTHAGGDLEVYLARQVGMTKMMSVNERSRGH